MRYVLCLACLMLFSPCYPYTLRPDAPAQYRVKSGDTLWEISSRFLVYPWEWHSLWHANPAIKNPDRLYPGAVIELRNRKRAPYLKVLSRGVVRLSPSPHPEEATDVIPAISLHDIKPFLNGSLVLDRNVLKKAPYVLAFMTEHMIGGQGDEVYVKDLCPPDILPSGQTISYALYRRSGQYLEPITGRFLGYKASLVGYAELVRGGDPATIVLTDIVQGVRLSDRVMPNNHPAFDLCFEPKAPSMPISGTIIDILGDFSQGAEGLAVVIDRGQDAGLLPGDVLGVYSIPRVVNNKLYTHYSKTPPCQFPCAQLPPERIGEVMVFRTFTHTSVALVMRSIRAVSLRATVTNP